LLSFFAYNSSPCATFPSWLPASRRKESSQLKYFLAILKPLTLRDVSSVAACFSSQGKLTALILSRHLRTPHLARRVLHGCLLVVARKAHNFVFFVKNSPHLRLHATCPPWLPSRHHKESLKVLFYVLTVLKPSPCATCPPRCLLLVAKKAHTICNFSLEKMPTLCHPS